jgi:hypothetical protein
MANDPVIEFAQRRFGADADEELLISQSDDR